MLVTLRRIMCAALVIAGAWVALGASLARAQGYGSDPIPYAPYGMDPVPPAIFYRGAWDYYGSDPTPRSYTSDLGFHDAYGLDPVPDAIVPAVRDLRYVLPIQELEVLTGAIEGSDADD